MRTDQLRRHLRRLDKTTEATQVLLVLTPDQSEPKAFDQLRKYRQSLAWASFVALDLAIDEMLDDKQEVVLEREAFPLRELQSMLMREKLTGSARDVLVVAGRRPTDRNQPYTYPTRNRAL